MNRIEKLRMGSILFGVFLIAVNMVFSAPVKVYADVESTQKQIDEYKNAAKQTKDAINQNQGTLNSLTGTQNALQGELNEFQSQITSITEKMNELEDAMSDKQDEIEETTTELERTQQELEEAVEVQDKQYAAMKKRIQFMYERGQNAYIEILLGASSFGDLLNRKNYINDLSKYDREQLDAFIAAREAVQARKAEIEEQKAALEAEHEELEQLHEEHAGQQQEVSELITQKSSDLNVTKEQLASAQSVTNALKTQLDQQNKEISRLQKQLEEEKRLQELSDRSKWRDISQVEFAEGDRYLLANLIYCEAGGEPYAGQVAVGAVVMNRVMSGAFPSTVSGVIYQSWQFEPAATGRLAVALAEDKATDSCYQAADAAMQGQTNVDNCLFFRTPIPEIDPKYRIGGHIFY